MRIESKRLLAYVKIVILNAYELIDMNLSTFFALKNPVLKIS